MDLSRLLEVVRSVGRGAAEESEPVLRMRLPAVRPSPTDSAGAAASAASSHDSVVVLRRRRRLDGGEHAVEFAADLVGLHRGDAQTPPQAATGCVRAAAIMSDK